MHCSSFHSPRALPFLFSQSTAMSCCLIKAAKNITQDENSPVFPGIKSIIL